MKPTDYYQDEYWDNERPQILLPDQPQRKAQIELIRVLKNHTPPMGKILDIGCGDGRIYTQELTQISNLYVGIDISLTALKRARINNINVVQVNIENKFPFPNKLFDTIICVDVLEHLFNPEQLINTIRPLLNKGGYFIATVPNIAHFPHRLRILGGKFVAGGLAATAQTPWRDPHIRFFTVKSLEEMIKETGFQNVEIIGNNASLLERFPFISKALQKTIGKQKMIQISELFEPFSRFWPTLLAGRLIVIAQDKID